MTKFGKREDRGLIDLAVEAGLGAISDSGRRELKVDAVLVGKVWKQSALYRDLTKSKAARKL